jgi:hypothetical protein
MSIDIMDNVTGRQGRARASKGSLAQNGDAAAAGQQVSSYALSMVFANVKADCSSAVEKSTRHYYSLEGIVMHAGG